MWQTGIYKKLQCKYMDNRAIKLYIKKDTTLAILFLDGTTREYDVLLLAKKYPQLNKLKNRELCDLLPPLN